MTRASPGPSLRGAIRALHAGEAPSEPADWRALAADAAAHGLVIPLFAWLRPVLPPDAARWYDFRAQAARLHHGLLVASIENLLSALERAGIRAVPLKGPLLAERLYDPPFGRPSSDVDVLVEPNALDRACEALHALGYALPPEAGRRRALAQHHDFRLVHPAALPIELHFRAQSSFGARVPAAALLDRASPARLPGGGPTWRLDPIDEFVYLGAHAAAHRFERLGWTHELALLARHDHISSDRALTRARDLGVERAVRAALGALAAIGAPLHDAPTLAVRPRLALALTGDFGAPGNTIALLATELLLADDAKSALRHLRQKALIDAPRRLGR